MNTARIPCSARTLTLAVALTAGLAGCGERTQELQAKKPDATPWSGAATAHAGAGWSGGDKAAWEAQIRQRNQNQNEYGRAPARP